jgi:predicted DNA-binding ribbon-helix-helix protein
MKLHSLPGAVLVTEFDQSTSSTKSRSCSLASSTRFACVFWVHLPSDGWCAQVSFWHRWNGCWSRSTTISLESHEATQPPGSGFGYRVRPGSCSLASSTRFACVFWVHLPSDGWCAQVSFWHHAPGVFHGVGTGAGRDRQRSRSSRMKLHSLPGAVLVMMSRAFETGIALR